MQKKIISAVVLVVFALVLFVISRTKAVESLMGTLPKNADTVQAELSRDTSENDTEKYSGALLEGCYKANEYVLEIVNLGSDDTDTYNAILYRSDTGACVFSGSAFEVEKSEKSVCFVSGGSAHLLLNVDRVDSQNGVPSLLVSVTYKGSPLSYLGGGYSYSGKTWVADVDVNADSIVPGVYRSANNVFLLYITEKDCTVNFIIEDISSQKAVFMGKCYLNEAGNFSGLSSVAIQNTVVNSASLEEKISGSSGSAQMVKFDKGRDANGVGFVEITNHGVGSSQKDYAGKYIYEGREYLTAGEYTSNGRTLTIYRSTIKGKNNTGNEVYRFSGLITLTDKDGTILFTGSKEFSGNERFRSVSFETGENEIYFFKGLGDDGDYIEVIDLGYADGKGSCERYIPADKSSG